MSSLLLLSSIYAHLFLQKLVHTSQFLSSSCIVDMVEEIIPSAAQPCFVVLVATNGLLLFLFGLIIIFKHYLPLLLSHACLPKGNFGWPLLGETLAFLKPHASNALGSFLQVHSSRYGKVFKSHLFFSPAIVSCDQELNYFILQNEDKLFQCSYPKPIHGVLGQSSMLVVVGETHRRLRSLALTLVTTTKSSPHYLNDIETIALQITTSWKSKPHVIFCQEARKFTFNVIVKQVLGLTPQDPQTERILDDFRAFMKGLISFPLYIPGTPYARAVQARTRISATVKALIEERRSGINNNNYNKNNANDDDDKYRKDDFLEVLLRVSNLSEDEKVSFVLDSLLGGYETTSLLMAMAVHFLGQSPSALQQLKDEYENIRSAKGNDEYLNWEDYKKMEFTQNVIHETLRCGNIVKFVHRKAIKDVRFKEYFIPSGWKVLPVFSAVHLDQSLHDDALKFHPWRWETQGQSCKKFTPFGGGPRFCPGSELAKVETAFFLYHLVLNFRWKVEGVEQAMAYPYVEFPSGLPLKLEVISSEL